MELIGTKHFKARCKERQLSDKQIKEAVRKGKTSISLNKDEHIKVITKLVDGKRYLLTAYTENTNRKSKANFKSSKTVRSKLRRLKEKYEDYEE